MTENTTSTGELNVVGQFPRRCVEIENTWIPMTDGCRLAARVWLPVDAEEEPVPAILEYLPYRKRDGTAARDEQTHPYLAGHGYACVRVDLRGNGESDGVMFDEYLKQEQDDALEVIAWIAGQAWCDGNVGMMGISWGGFNSLQVAARRPPSLKAIITICSTDDRYADDIHYKGGALLMENLGWASTMFAFSSRPPDPALVGDRWRSMWLERVENTPLLIENWLSHPHRDDYWKHGSICEDFAEIEAAVFAVGGWGDAYRNTIPRMLANLKAPAKGLTGPWVHKYPHLAVPGPAIGFLQESLRWFDHWLKGRESGIMDEPLYRAYLMDSVRPHASYVERPGRWIAEEQWPCPNIETRAFALNAGTLDPEAKEGQELTVFSPQDTGTAGGEYCAMWLGPEGPADQREDDAGSLVFDTAPLTEPLEIFGATAVTLELAADQPVATIAVRLCDVWPEGDSTRVSYGILNLTHREDHESPSPLEPGKHYRVRVQLDDVAYAFPPGHRIRVAISTAYWPLVWPSPTPVTLTLWTGISQVELPVRPPRAETVHPFEPPEAAPPMAEEMLRPAFHGRTIERDLANATTTVCITDDFGRSRIKSHGLITDEVCTETYRIQATDPLSCRAEIHWTECLARDTWSVRTETNTVMWADREHFHIQADLEGFENDDRLFNRSWTRKVERQLV